MTVGITDNGTIRLIDDCPAQDAELLLSRLLAGSETSIDWGSCRSAHTAVIQVLLASRHALTGQPQGAFLKTMVRPALDRARR
jgi:hypothetical protein